MKLDPSIEWLCGNFEGDFDTFKVRWEEVMNSPNIIVNYNVVPTSVWQGNSKTYTFNEDHLMVRFDSRAKEEQVSISIRVNSQSAFQSDAPTASALEISAEQPTFSNTEMTIEGSSSSSSVDSEGITVTDVSPSSCIDLNTASTQELRLIAFIDEAKSDEIVVRRNIQAYRSIDELIYITDIDEAQLNEIKAQNLACVQ